MLAAARGTRAGSDIDREMARAMEMIGGGTASPIPGAAMGAKLPYVEDVVMSRRGGISQGANAGSSSTPLTTGDHLETRSATRASWSVHSWRDLGCRASRGIWESGRQHEAAILQTRRRQGSALNLVAANRIVMLEPGWTWDQPTGPPAPCAGQRRNPVWFLVAGGSPFHRQAVIRALRRKQSGLTELWRAAS
jgi:hypothetical protein